MGPGISLVPLVPTFFVIAHLANVFTVQITDFMFKSRPKRKTLACLRLVASQCRPMSGCFVDNHKRVNCAPAAVRGTDPPPHTWNFGGMYLLEFNLVLVLAWWQSSEIIHTRVHVPRLLAMATIWERRLFCSRASDCVATIRGWRLFEEIQQLHCHYSLNMMSIIYLYIYDLSATFPTKVTKYIPL